MAKTAVSKYNGLKGPITIQRMQKLAEQAKKEGQTILADRIIAAIQLAKAKKLKYLRIVSVATPQATAEDLAVFECCPEDYSNEDPQGLSKPVSSDDIYQMITDKMIELVEKASGSGYVKKWKNDIKSGFAIPFNFISKKPYRGINVALLTEFGTKTLKNPFFMTFKQIEKEGGKIKKGSTAHKVVYFTTIYSYQQAAPNALSLYSSDLKTFKNLVLKNKSKIEVLKGASALSVEQLIEQSKIPVLKYYNVFNGVDITGIDFKLDTFTTGYVDVDQETKEEDPRIDAAEKIVANYPKPSPKLTHGSTGASYNIGGDIIKMPDYANFATGLDYYRTLFHEYSHSTGSFKRLNRPFGSTFGSAAYAKEELVAEFGAVFLSSWAGIMWRNNQNHAEYLKGWRNSLKHIKNDNKLLMRAASAAQASTDFILNYDDDGMPEFLKAENQQPVVKKDLDWSDPKTYSQDLDLQRSRRSYYGISFSPEKRGDSELKWFGEDLANTYKEYRKLAEDNEVNMNEFHQAWEKFYKYVLRDKKDLIGKRSNLLSTMIAGPANFPVRKAERANSSFNAAMEKYIATWDRGKKKIMALIFPTRTIKSGEKNTVALLQQKIKQLELLNEKQKLVNRHFKKSKPTIEEVQDFALNQGIYKIALDLGISKSRVDYRIGDFVNKGWNFVLDMYATRKIRELKDRLVGESRRTDRINSIGEGYVFDQGEVVLNQEQNRIQLLFDEKPDEQTRAKLKSNGYRWSPKNRAWQRQMTNNAIIATQRLFPPKSKKTPAQQGKQLEMALNGSSPTKSKPKPRQSRQKSETGLAGATESKGEYSEPGQPVLKKHHPKVKSLSEPYVQSTFFQIPGPTGEFLQSIERKPTGSVVITLDGPQGSGKTTLLYRFMEDFAAGGHNVLFASLEEHQESHLAKQKADLYLSERSKSRIGCVSDIESKAELHELILSYDIIFIDSWQKLIRMVGTLRLDEDLRKKYDGKVFVIIFQQTTTGRTKGGAEIVFDGDVITKLYKSERFKENYAYFDKNRYTKIPLDQIRMMVATGEVIIDGQETEDLSDSVEGPWDFDFEVV